MNKLKRLLALVLVMCFMTTSVVIVSNAEEETTEPIIRNAYEAIMAPDADELYGTSAAVNAYGVNTLGGSIIGAWARYDNVDFGTGEVKEFQCRINGRRGGYLHHFSRQYDFSVYADKTYEYQDRKE